MALLDVDAITTRVRAVLAGSAGTVRTIASTRFLGDMPDGLSDEEKAIRATVKPRYEVVTRDLGYSEASPPRLHSVAIKRIGVQVTITRPYSFTEATSDTARDDATSLAAQDFDALSQALGFPGNVTIAGTDTVVVSGLLTPDGEPDYRAQMPDGDRPGLITTVCNFTGTVIVTQATS